MNEYAAYAPLGPSATAPTQGYPVPLHASHPPAPTKPPKKLSKKATKALDENAAARASGSGDGGGDGGGAAATAKDADKDLKKGAWTDEEDAALRHFIQV